MVLIEPDLEASKYSLLDEMVGGHSMDPIESGILTKLFRKLVAPGVLCNHRSCNLLAITVILNRLVGRPLPKADFRGDVTRQTHRPSTSWGFTCTWSCHSTVFNRGEKYVHSTEQAGRLNNLSLKARRRAT